MQLAGKVLFLSILTEKPCIKSPLRILRMHGHKSAASGPWSICLTIGVFTYTRQIRQQRKNQNQTAPALPARFVVETRQHFVFGLWIRKKKWQRLMWR
ncbi:hypothetical protein SeKA_B0059 (plasmid) [Salmonella enterica subsp. enterica serovar Kentucky str. CVM29188]|nr:hypothetical protein SeKA_B0059 [Salmonella enterica subsp. enterica serovar Kentucky str. CVM29188]